MSATPVSPLSHVVGLVGFTAVLALAQPALAQDGPNWVVSEISGQVRAHGRAGAPEPLARGNVLAEGRTIETGPNARLVLIHGKDLVTVSPNSVFRIPPSNNSAAHVGFIQKLGTILYRVEHRPTRGFEVDAPALVAVVKGTVFTVTASKSADSVHVAGGAVQVTSLHSHKIVLVHPGEVAVVSSAGRDLTILGDPASGNKVQRRSEYDDPDDDALGTSTSAAAPGVTERERAKNAPELRRTMGEEHLDIPAVTKGLIGDGSAHGAAGYFANRSADGRNIQAATGNPNAMGGNPSAMGGNVNAVSAIANANINSAANSANAAQGRLPSNTPHGHGKP